MATTRKSPSLPPTPQLPVENFSSFSGARRFQREFFPQLQPYSDVNHANTHLDLLRKMVSEVPAEIRSTKHILYLGAYAAFSTLEVTDAITERNHAHQQHVDAQADLFRIRQERNTYLDDRNSAITTNEALHLELAKHQKQLAELTSSNSKLRQERSTILSERNLARADHKQLATEHTSLQQDIARIRHERTLAITARDDAVARGHQTERERDNLHRDLTTTQQNQSDTNSDRASLIRDLERIRHERDTYLTERDDTCTMNDTLQQDLARIRHERDNSAAERDEARFTFTMIYVPTIQCIMVISEFKWYSRKLKY